MSYIQGMLLNDRDIENGQIQRKKNLRVLVILLADRDVDNGQKQLHEQFRRNSRELANRPAERGAVCMSSFG